MKRSTAQEEFWETEFGDEYTERNRGAHWIASNTAFFAKIFALTQTIDNVLELGSNSGLNLAAIRCLLPNAKLSAVEINQKAADELEKNLVDVDLHRTSILEFQSNRKWDFVFSKGVLIHLDPQSLPRCYDLMHATSSRYVMVAEYFNPKPVELSYRGHANRLFKRDFAGEMLDRHADLSLVDYGFVYHRDNHFPQDDLTWFLMEKSQSPIVYGAMTTQP